MKYRRLGQSGCKVSAVGLGTWLTFGSRLHDNVANSIVQKALGRGINYIDTADVYDQGKAEEQLGRALADVPRKDYVLASKVFFPTGDGPNDRGLSRKHIHETVHASLRRLGTDYVDLYQCHRYDEETPLEETVRAFDDLIRQGKILYWGVSVWTAEQIERAVEVAHQLGAAAPVTNQPPYSLLKREIEADVLPATRRCGLGTLAYSPLAQGVLTGKYLDDRTPRDSRLADEKRNKFMAPYLEEPLKVRVRALVGLAKQLGVSAAQLALAWVLHQDGVTSVIAGATKPNQVDDNAAAADIRFEPEHLARLNEIFPT